MKTPPDSGLDDPTNQPAPSVARPLCRECDQSEAGCTCPGHFSPLYFPQSKDPLTDMEDRYRQMGEDIAAFKAQQTKEDYNQPPAWLLSKEREEKIAETLGLQKQFTARENEPPTLWSGIFFAFLILVGAGVGITLAALVIKLLFK